MFDIEAVAGEAWIFGLPLIETANARASLLRRTPPNTFFHYRNLVTPRSQTVTTPNVDTLYSTAWLDLRNGPVSVSVPSFGKRYLSVALLDTYTNNFALLGTRTTGDAPLSFSVAGPSHDSSTAIRSPTTWAWLLIRASVDGAENLDTFHALQDACRIDAAPTTAPFAPGCAPDADAATVLATLRGLLQESPPNAHDDRALPSLQALNLVGARAAPSFGESELRHVRSGFDQAHARLLAAQQGIARDGWLTPQPNMGAFGTDFRYRAQIAVKGLAALPNIEAMYFWGLGPDGSLSFDSAKNWTFTLPHGHLPVSAFWSLTAYELVAGGKNYLFDNPINRYALGSHRTDLFRAPDGSITIYVQRDPPTDAPISNWLPAPRAAPAQLVLRAYLPKPSLLKHAYRIPSITQAR